MNCRLSEIATYVNERVTISKLTLKTYISTENMISDKRGVTFSSGLPSVSTTQAFKQGDVLVSNIRPYFKKIWLAEYDGGCSNDVLVFRPKEEIVSSEFLYFVLSDDAFFDYMMASSKGTKMPRGDRKAIIDYPISDFAISHQDQITRILLPLNRKIHVNAKLNDNLEKQLELMYRKLKMDSGCSEIATIESFCSIFTGKKNANQFDEGGMYKFFTCGDTPLRINSFIHDGAAIIISGNGSYTGRTTFYKGKFDLYQRTYACSPLENVNPDLIYGLYPIIKYELQRRINGGTHGSSIPYIVFNDIAKFEFKYNRTNFPEYSLQCKNLILAILNNQKEIDALQGLRDYLLPLLMSGQIAIGD